MFSWLIDLWQYFFSGKPVTTKWDIKVGSHGFCPMRSGKDRERFDLFCPISTTIYPGMRRLLDTDVSVELSTGTYAKIVPELSLLNNGVSIDGGIISHGKKINVAIAHSGKRAIVLHRGQRFAQLICERI